jgi:hypothetical protein
MWLCGYMGGRVGSGNVVISFFVFFLSAYRQLLSHRNTDFWANKNVGFCDILQKTPIYRVFGRISE